MFCLKCGREIESGVFCVDCLFDMAKYPVKPGTAIQLPKRRESTPVRKMLSWRKTVTPEEQVRKLRKSLRTMIVLWVITFLLFCAALFPAVSYLMEDHFLPGQNYSLIDSLLPTEA